MHAHRHILLSQVLFTIWITASLGISLAHARENEPNNLVAIVNGKKIFYHSIKSDPKTLRAIYAQELSTKQLAKEKQQNEMRRLVGRVQGIILEQKIADFGLTATEEEVRSKVEETFEKAGLSDEKAKALCENINTVYEALLEWHENPSTEDAIYNKNLAGRISKQRWKLFQSCYNTTEKLKHFKVPKNIDDMKKNSFESSKRDVLYEKLNSIITKDVVVTNQEIIEAYDKKYSHISEKPSFLKVKDELHKESLTQKKKAAIILWRQKQFRQAKIEVKNPQFTEVLNILRNLKQKN